MKRSKEDLIKTLRTGKIPGRRNLLKHLFTLVGLSARYGGVKFSDGYSSGRRSRVVVKCSTSFIKVEHLDKMREYVPGLRMLKNPHKGATTFMYFKNEVDWNRIDEHTKNRN